MQVEVSREYYVIACKRQYMHLHEMVVFELYDAINYGHVRSIRACPEDVVSVRASFEASKFVNFDEWNNRTPTKIDSVSL